MNPYEFPGLVIIFNIGFLVTVIVFSSFFPKRLKHVIIAAFFVRVLGTLVRYLVMYDFYDGGDAGRYYRYGLTYAEMIWNFDFSFLMPENWTFGRMGTQAVMAISGFILSVMGPSIRGEFLLFSMFSFVGVLFFCKSFERNLPHADLRKYAMWILFWPSVWFWTSSVGKDALILLATALVVYGYTGKKQGGIHWLSIVTGLALASLIRPHVGGLLAVAVVIAHWISPKSKWTFFHWVQGLAIVVIATFLIRSGFSTLGVTDIDIVNVKEYLDHVSVQTTQGGSAIHAPGFSLTGIPFAFVNVLFRPFPWEAGHPLTFLASLEVIIFWSVVWYRRRRIARVARHWRHNKLLRVALPLTVLYILMLGLAVGNLGIIVRQRIHVLPLLFIWLEALPYTRQVKVQTKPSLSDTQHLAKLPA